MPNKQYPKPLSAKSLQRKYAELKLSDEKIAFIKDFIFACTNLYGFISIADAWEVYKALAQLTTVPVIKRVDLLRISEVFRREELPYFTFEIDEIFSEEPRSDLERQFVSRKIIRSGYGKFVWYYDLEEKQYMHDYYVPENLLSFVEMPTSLYEQSLLAFVGKLKVTADEYETSYGQIKKCSDHKGETLDSFSFMNEDEMFNLKIAKGEIDGYKGNEKEAQRLITESESKTEAQKIVENFKWHSSIGNISVTKNIEYTVRELEEVGVELTEEQFAKLVEKAINLHNNSHLMCIKGWKPVDL